MTIFFGAAKASGAKRSMKAAIKLMNPTKYLFFIISPPYSHNY
jgi:hypothetical protein